MNTKVTLEELERLAAQLSPEEQLKLVVRICEQLSVISPAMVQVVSEEVLRCQREQDVKALLALCDAVAEQWKGKFDAAEEIRQLRHDRDEG